MPIIILVLTINIYVNINNIQQSWHRPFKLIYFKKSQKFLLLGKGQDFQNYNPQYNKYKNNNF